MGMKLRAIYPMRGIKGAKHCFLEATNEMRIKLSVASLRCVLLHAGRQWQ